MSNPYVGSSFDDCLREEGIEHDVTQVARLRVLRWGVIQALKSRPA